MNPFPDKYTLPASILAKASGLKGEWRWNEEGDPVVPSWNVGTGALMYPPGTVGQPHLGPTTRYGPHRRSLVPHDDEAKVWAALAYRNDYWINYHSVNVRLRKLLREQRAEQDRTPTTDADLVKAGVEVAN